jgi:TIGR03009 family protein
MILVSPYKFKRFESGISLENPCQGSQDELGPFLTKMVITVIEISLSVENASQGGFMFSRFARIFTFFAVYSFSRLVFAQGSLPVSSLPVNPIAPNPAQPTPLDGILKQWEQQMQRVEFLTANLALIEKDKVFNAVRTSTGTAKYMKSGALNQPVLLASLEFRKENKAETDRKFLCTGNFLYELDYGQKVVRAFEMPKPKPGQVADDSFLTFIFGMKAEEAKLRYNLSLDKEDQHYSYISVIPKLPGDRADFQRAQLVLLRATFLPRRLWFEKPNGDETTWDISLIDTKKPVDRKEFDPPQLGKDWRWMQATAPGIAGAPPTQPGPRVARPSP